MPALVQYIKSIIATIGSQQKYCLFTSRLEFSVIVVKVV